MEIRRDSSNLSYNLEVFHKGDREEFVKQAKNKIRQFGDLFHQRYVSILPLVKYITIQQRVFFLNKTHRIALITLDLSPPPKKKKKKMMGVWDY